MTLAHIYYLLAAVLLLAGALLFTGASVLRTFRRSANATYLLAGGAMVWFGWWLMNLPAPDLVDLPRIPVVAVFMLASLATFKYMPDFLSIRGLGVLMMFLARLVLDTGFGHLPHSFFSALFAYVLLVIPGLWWAASPPAFVQWCDWLLATPGRHRVAGAILGACAVISLWQGFNL